ncbi:hypothetical protein [Streptomyces sp. NPDC018352]|uniref:hypothetical protein n=1 Tax=Streptomyces sp. NPDC018352 TaxID=3157194 RepID=UPI0033DED578
MNSPGRVPDSSNAAYRVAEVADAVSIGVERLKQGLKDQGLDRTPGDRTPGTAMLSRS